MNIEREKKRIIEELPYINEEWRLKAIKKILDIEDVEEIEKYEEEYEEEEEEIPEEKPKKKDSIATVRWDDIQEKISGKK